MSKYSNFDLIKKLKNVSILCSLLLLVAFSCVSTANAYQLKNYKWPQPSTTFYVDIPGENGLWNDAFEGAMYEWGVNTVFQYYIVSGTYEDPCDATEGKNGVKFSSTDCGDAWGSTTLAVCHTWYIASTSTITQTDIVFNSNEPWNVYSTSWSYNVNDFHRVAVHELGHALGLGHEDSGVSTIMGTYAGDITIPQQDDIDGVAALYGSACTYSISPTSGSFTSSGGSSSVSVTASSSTCAWTASESLSWVSLSPTSGTGSGTVTVSVSANTGSARSGSVTIAGKTYSISQAAPIPGKVTLISPLGTIKNTIPTFTWNEESSATFYYLYIWDENHNEVHKDWYTIADDNLNYDKANCSNGYCTVTLDFELEEGSYEWFIKVYNGYYQGDYSDGMSFTVQSNIQNIYYDDYDGDGYGNPNKSMSASSQPYGYVSNKTDCNDTNASVHPGATEIAGDNIDQDCNGSDLAVSKTWYLDYDGDGYGDSSSSISSATNPNGYVADKTDCNDNDATVHPGAIEIAGDGIDQDCDGSDLTSSTGLTQIILLSPTDNKTISFGASGGEVAFSFSKLANAAKYTLHLYLNDILNNNSVAIPIELIPPGTTNSTPGFSEIFLGVYKLALDTATWDVLALYDLKWGVEAYDSAGSLIGSTFEGSVATKYINSLKFIASNSIAMTSPTLGEELSLTGSAPTLKWDAYQGVSNYALILAHMGSLGFDSVLTKDNLTLTLFPMDNAAWQSMPTGTWYWTIFGYNAMGTQTPSGFTIFNFDVTQ